MLAPAIIHNVTLKKLDLSRNPLGSYGGRVIVHAYNNSKVQDREMIFQGCDLSLEDVKNVTDFNQFDPDKLARIAKYLANPVGKLVLSEKESISSVIS